MNKNQSRPKKGEIGYDSDHDLLSDLPLGIIHIILALVPIREVVRTSVLSRQWRYTWTRLPQLVFDRRCTSQKDKSVSKYEDFITRVLLRHKGPIHKFEISSHFEGTKPFVDDWVFCLSRNDIREVSLKKLYSSGTWLKLHSSIYFCEKLTTLKLCRCKLVPPPSTFKGFLFLKCLSLVRVKLSPHVIETLVASCPLLERFELLHAGNMDLRIRAPNLKYLCLKGRFMELCVYAPLLDEMSVEIDYHDALEMLYQRHKISTCNYTKCIGGCTNLEKLHGEAYFTKYLSLGIESCHDSIMFHNLKVIELSNLDPVDVKVILVVAHLIVGAPNLHQLKLQLHIGYEVDDASEAWYAGFRDLGCPPNFTLEKLCVVEVRGVNGLFFEKELIKFLLKTSPGLESMNVYYMHGLDFDEIQILKDQLMGYDRASSNAEIVCLDYWASA